MLMNANAQERYDFVTRVTRGDEPAYRLTQEGDPERQDWWRAHQPNLYAARRIQEHRQEAA